MNHYLKHTIFWLSIYFLWTYMKSGAVFCSTYLLVNLVNVALYMLAYYLLKYVQIPRFYDKGKMVEFIFSFLISSFLLYVIWRIMGVWWVDELRGIRYKSFMSFVNYLTQTVQFYSPAMLLLAWEYREERQQEQQRIQQLEKEKIASELKFLKAQLNPHFLFNTLNNLYSFVVMGSPKAPDMILRLSGILDYILYKSQQQFVPLQEEVNTIEHFIELEKVRYGERLQVNFTTAGNLFLPISPLLFLSLVENAFKHGASGDIDEPKINIEIKGTDEKINCKVWNSKRAYEGELNDTYKEGIGLSNIKRQLNLIYPDNYDLEIDDKEDSFLVAITIKSEK